MAVPPAAQRFFFGVAPPVSKAPLGDVWRFTAKSHDFYIDHSNGEETMHLSMHGPRRHHSNHRFHIKVKREWAATAHELGVFAAHGIGKEGFKFDGVAVSPDAYHVLRIRWTADILRRKYRQCAYAESVPEPTSQERGFLMSKRVGTGDCVDLDVFMSYGKPYISGGVRAQKDNAVLGPVANENNMWLSATCARRLQRDHPMPESFDVPKPGRGDEPNRFFTGGTKDSASDGIYWFVHDITTRACVERSMEAWKANPDR